MIISVVVLFHYYITETTSELTLGFKNPRDFFSKLFYKMQSPSSTSELLSAVTRFVYFLAPLLELILER